MSDKEQLFQLFTEKAKLVSAIVSEVSTPRQAFEYAADLCAKKEACQLLFSGCEGAISEPAKDLCDMKSNEKVIAAPGLTKKHFKEFSDICAGKGVTLIEEGLRSRLAGIDIGFSFADYGIAETGSLVFNSNSEELRLSTMVSEIHVAVLPKSKLRATTYDVEKEIVGWAKKGPAYTAFITGASRTADIERVLALGVHGPLEMHVLLLEDK